MAEPFSAVTPPRLQETQDFEKIHSDAGQFLLGSSESPALSMAAN
jgi:hypothetical protein